MKNIKKKSVIAIGVIILIGVIALVIRLSQPTNTFTGNRIKNSDKYELSFTYMHQDDQHTLKCQKDDRIHCNWEIEEGKVDVYIRAFDGEVVYQGNDIDKADFEIQVLREGSYTVEVSCKKAKGTIIITVE